MTLRILNKLGLAALLACTSLPASAFVLTGFTTAPSSGSFYIPDALAATAAGGGVNPLDISLTGSGAGIFFEFELPAVAPVDLTSLTTPGNQLSLRFGPRAGNAATSLNLQFLDSSLTVLAQYNFGIPAMPGIVSVSGAVDPGVALGDLSSASYMFLTMSSTDSVRISADSLSIIPEPATYAVAAGALALALVVLRRRRSA
jgi:hypothetical protein